MMMSNASRRSGTTRRSPFPRPPMIGIPLAYSIADGLAPAHKLSRAKGVDGRGRAKQKSGEDGCYGIAALARIYFVSPRQLGNPKIPKIETWQPKPQVRHARRTREDILRASHGTFRYLPGWTEGKRGSANLTASSGLCRAGGTLAQGPERLPEGIRLGEDLGQLS